MSQTDSKTSAPSAREFGRAFDRELTAMLRRRFLWLCAIWIAITMIAYAFQIGVPIARFIQGEGFSVSFSGLPRMWVLVFGEFGRLVTLALSVWLLYTRCKTRESILRLAFWTLTIIGLLSIVVRVDPARISSFAISTPTTLMGPLGDGPPEFVDNISHAGTSIAFAHLFMCLFIPWTPSRAAKPLIILAPIWIIATLLLEGVTAGLIFRACFVGPVVSGTGLLVCWLRTSRLRSLIERRIMQREVASVRQELVDARRIHETRFPAPITDGHVRLHFSYEPMRQIGGDFLHVHRNPNGVIHAAIIDVTGHGIAAALAVNRIDGEIARVVAEHPDVPPGEMLYLLNRYIHLTMARHSLYATAFCFSLAPDGTLLWANGGHPPAMLRRANGEVESLTSTTFMLGACPGAVFDPDPQSTKLDPNEVLVVYTDGACEARDARGKQFGIVGLERAIAHWSHAVDDADSLKSKRPTRATSRASNGHHRPPPRDHNEDVVSFLAEAIRSFRHGPPEDDVLFTAARIE